MAGIVISCDDLHDTGRDAVLDDIDQKRGDVVSASAPECGRFSVARIVGQQFLKLMLPRRAAGAAAPFHNQRPARKLPAVIA